MLAACRASLTALSMHDFALGTLRLPSCCLAALAYHTCSQCLAAVQGGQMHALEPIATTCKGRCLAGESAFYTGVKGVCMLIWRCSGGQSRGRRRLPQRKWRHWRWCAHRASGTPGWAPPFPWRVSPSVAAQRRRQPPLLCWLMHQEPPAVAKLLILPYHARVHSLSLSLISPEDATALDSLASIDRGQRDHSPCPDTDLASFNLAEV